MTLDELRALIRAQIEKSISEEAEISWGEIDSAIKKVVDASISGVIENRDKILGEKKTLKEKTDELEAKVKAIEDAGITVESYNELKAKVEAGGSSGDADHPDIIAVQKEYYEKGRKAMEQELKPTIQALTTEKDSLEKTTTELKTKHVNSLKDSELNRAISELRVEADPFWFKGFAASASVEYNEIEDRVDIELPNPIDPSQRVPLKDWKKLFKVSDEGKKRIRVDISGGGAGGSNGKGGQKSQTLAQEINSMFT